MAEPATRREPSPLEAALERVGDRWSLLIVEALLDGPRRFNELGEAVAGIAPNILTDRLRRLERERIVVVDALPGASAADVVLADRRRPGPRLGAPDARRLGLAHVARRGTRPATAAAARRSRPAGSARPARSSSTAPTPTRRARSSRAHRPPAAPGYTREAMEDERWEPGMPVLDRQAVRTPDAPAEPPGPAASLGPRGRPDAAPAPLLNLSVIVLICGRDRDHGARTRRLARQPAGQAVRHHRCAAARGHDRRRDPAHLALGLGLDADRPRQRAPSAWPGWRSA